MMLGPMFMGVARAGAGCGAQAAVAVMRPSRRRSRLRVQPARFMTDCAAPSTAGNMSDKLFHNVSKIHHASTSKVTVVGTGQVGMATIICLLTQGVTNNVALLDMTEDKIKGEMLDLQHGSCFLNNCHIEASKDYKVSANSKICIIAAGTRQKKGQTRLDLLQSNVNIFKEIIPKLVKYSPECILLLATNPVDVVSYVTWRVSGLPATRVIGSGTNLDSARFRYLLSERLQVAPTSVHGFVIGEHGDSSVPVWSSVNIAGTRLRDLNPKIGLDDDPENWGEVHKDVVNSGYKVRGLKGFTSWAIGLSICNISKAIITNAHTMHPVSTHVKGELDIPHDIFLSLPCVIGSDGVTSVLRQHLTDLEKELLHKSANVIAKAQESITF